MLQESLINNNYLQLSHPIEIQLNNLNTSQTKTLKRCRLCLGTSPQLITPCGCPDGQTHKPCLAHQISFHLTRTINPSYILNPTPQQIASQYSRFQSSCELFRCPFCQHKLPFTYTPTYPKHRLVNLSQFLQTFKQQILPFISVLLCVFFVIFGYFWILRMHVFQIRSQTFIVFKIIKSIFYVFGYFALLVSIFVFTVVVKENFKEVFGYFLRKDFGVSRIVV